jgi:hypothetical protein
MTTTVTISDALAARLEARRAKAGLASLDQAAEALLVLGLAAEAPDEGADVRALVEEAEADGC